MAAKKATDKTTSSTKKQKKYVDPEQGTTLFFIRTELNLTKTKLAKILSRGEEKPINPNRLIAYEGFEYLPKEQLKISMLRNMGIDFNASVKAEKIMITDLALLKTVTRNSYRPLNIGEPDSNYAFLFPEKYIKIPGTNGDWRRVQDADPQPILNPSDELTDIGDEHFEIKGKNVLPEKIEEGILHLIITIYDQKIYALPFWNENRTVLTLYNPFPPMAKHATSFVEASSIKEIFLVIKIKLEQQ